MYNSKKDSSNNIGYRESYFTSSFDDLSKEDRQKELEKIILRRNEILKSKGYTFNDCGKLISPKKEIIDGILGFSIADALGVPVEFSSREKMMKNPLKDMIGYGSHLVPEGTWSDDTSMILATMDSIVENDGIDYNDIMYKFYQWFQYGKYTATDEVFDVGKTVRLAILKFKDGCNIFQCGCGGYTDNGNGSLMRILPIVFYLHENNFTEDEEVEIINKVSSLTHSHEISCLGCKIFFDFINQLLDGYDKFEALNFIRNYNYSKYYSNNAIIEYKRILLDDFSKLDMDQISSSGYVVHTLEASLWSTINSNSFEEAVLKAINLGRDTDTIGAITGGVNGIIYGKKQIPERWLFKLRKKEYIEEMSMKFIASLNKNNLNIRNR